MTAEVIQIFHINTKVKLNNGKANLEFELIVHENAPQLLENVAFLEISVLDSEEHFIANASCKMREETILESIIGCVRCVNKKTLRFFLSSCVEVTWRQRIFHAASVQRR